MTSTLRLPVLAALCVLLSGVLLVATRGDPSASSPAGLRVVGAAGSFAVGPRWTATSGPALLYYADPSGHPVVGLSGAVVADAGYCAGLPTSTRGFAGFAGSGAAPEGADLHSVTRAVAIAWARGISGRSPPPVEVTPGRLVDGTPAARATVRLRTRPSGDPCLARRVVLDVVGLAGVQGVTALVVVRDVDPLGIGDVEVEEMVQSLRRRT